MKLEQDHASLGEVNRSVEVNTSGKGFKRLFAFLGPAYLVSVGYMDPGNWATDLAGGSSYGYALIWVLLMSNLIALLLQSHSARLGIVGGVDLAQASKQSYPKWINFSLYLFAEVAIAATDLAEVIGFAIGLQLLFKLPLFYGVVISLLDTFIILGLLKMGIRKMEAFILALVSVIGISFLVQLILAKPQVGEIAKGFIPSLPGETALFLAIGIIGATVMPHNLYLHSALVQTRNIGPAAEDKKKAIRFNFIDSVIALNAAFFVNAAILILAASTFFKNGYTEVAEIQDAYKLLDPLLGSSWSPVLFAVALIAAGQSSTVTGTLAGQVVMEGYLDIRIQPWLRRLITRLLATVPALLVIGFSGEDKTGQMLILSQVILSLQLGFAVIPLIHFVSDKSRMGQFAISTWIKLLSWISALVIVSLNLKLVLEMIVSFLQSDSSLLLKGGALALFAFVMAILVYITLVPFIKKKEITHSRISFHGNIAPLVLGEPKKYKRIAVSVDFSDTDSRAVNEALRQGSIDAEYCLIHVVETMGARLLGEGIRDLETEEDKKHLEDYVLQLQNNGYRVQGKIAFGVPSTAIVQEVRQFGAELLIMGAHGHKGVSDLILGSTIDTVRHDVTIPVLIVHAAN